MKKKLLFIGCNYNQIPYLKTLNKKEWKIVGVDKNKDAPGRILCDEFYNVAYDDLKGLIEVGKKEKFEKHDRVFSAASQFAQKGAANFAFYFGINFPPEKSIDLCLNKTLFYQYFRKNNIPIPNTWYIKNKNDLKLKINSTDAKNFFLKSDYSKNPNYVYKFNSDYIPLNDIFWGYDRFRRKYYILQEEFKGTSLRLNIYGSRFNVFNFLTEKKTIRYHDTIKKFKIISTLRRFINDHKIGKFLLKFDIILNNQSYVVLDIGLDPPMRMLKYSKQNNIKFEKYYLAHYISDKIRYPKILD